MKDTVKTRISLAVVPLCLAWIMRIWFCTCRLNVHNENNFDLENSSSKAIVGSFWHYTIIYLFYFVRKCSATVMVSASRDGDYIARFAGHFGFKTVRGSSNKQGVGALKEMLRSARRGENSAIVADGSQGPARVAQPGAILVASRAGVPVVPMTWSASKYIKFNSWDRLAIPLPFSRIDFYIGDPIFVPKKIVPEEIEQYRLQLEESLNAQYEIAWKRYSKTEH